MSEPMGSGAAPTIRAMGDQAIQEYVRSAAERAEIVGSVCTGALILGAAGLLEGRRATTHWGAYHLLEKLGARYVPERWVEDGKFITAAGVSAGIDMALHLVARLAGPELARQAQIYIEYDLSRRSEPYPGTASTEICSRPSPPSG